MTRANHADNFAPSGDKPSREHVDHANLDRRRRRGVHPRSEAQVTPPVPISRPRDTRAERSGPRSSERAG